MKKQYLILTIALIAPLASCNKIQSNENNPTIINAVNSLKYQSHNVYVKQSVDILRPIPEGMTPEDPNWSYLPIDIHREYDNYFTYYYGNNNEKAYSRQTNTTYYDLEKLTGEPIEETIRYDHSPKESFFRNEDLLIENEIIVEGFNKYFKNEVSFDEFEYFCHLLKERYTLAYFLL